MRILWVKSGNKLLPVDTGGKIRSYNLLRQLALRNEVTLVSNYVGARDDSYERDLQGHFPGAVAINMPRSRSEFFEGLSYCANFFSATPYSVAKFTTPRVRSCIEELLSSEKFDVAICDFLAASLNFPRRPGTPTVLFQHNVESVLWERQAKHERSLLKRIAYKAEALKMASYERTAVNRFDHVIAVSEADRDAMAAMTNRERISVVPTGVDLSHYSRREPTDARGTLVTFSGSMDWEANIDAVEYFVGEIWPAVRQGCPAARFRIVGRDPHRRVLRLASESVEVTGTVPSVIDHLRDSSVVIVPLRIGGGTRLKIYEAMAMGRAVVSTSVGAEGLDVNDGRDILIEDSANGFASSILKLLREDGYRASLESAAAAQASKFDWARIARQFETVLEEVR